MTRVLQGKVGLGAWEELADGWGCVLSWGEIWRHRVYLGQWPASQVQRRLSTGTEGMKGVGFLLMGREIGHRLQSLKKAEVSLIVFGYHAV